MTKKTLTSIAGRHISSVCEEAVEMAVDCIVEFEFNGMTVQVKPGETAAAVEERWQAATNAAREAWINSPEYKERERQREEQEKREREAIMVETAKTESEMRAAKVPWPRTEKQLAEYVASLINREHDYGTAAYAISMAATAAFNYVASVLGCTGFQASCADLDVLRRTRHLEGPFMIIKGEDALYPQYDLHEKLSEAMSGWKDWLTEEAQKKLAANDYAHPNVIAHWKKLAQEPISGNIQ